MDIDEKGFTTMKKLVMLALAFGVLFSGFGMDTPKASAAVFEGLCEKYDMQPRSIDSNYYFADGFFFQGTFDWKYSQGGCVTSPANVGNGDSLTVEYQTYGNPNDAIMIYIQRKINGTWTDVAHWGDTQDNNAYLRKTIYREYGNALLVGNADYRMRFSNPDASDWGAVSFRQPSGYSFSIVN